MASYAPLIVCLICIAVFVIVGFAFTVVTFFNEEKKYKALIILALFGILGCDIGIWAHPSYYGAK